MSERLSLLERLERARIFQVLAVCLGASVEDGRLAEVRRLLRPISGGKQRQGHPRADDPGGPGAGGWQRDRIHRARFYDWTRPRPVDSLARIHDERGDDARALAYDRSFLTTTREGEQDLPQIVEAREAVARLDG